MSTKLRTRTANVIDTVRYTTLRWTADAVVMVELEGIMERDVVCGMDVDPAKAPATSEYNGKTYYFCAKACKNKFDAEPQKYVK
jgi:YHS domain-containing protein